LLKKVCQKGNPARQAALEDELRSKGIRYENWNNMALVAPSAVEKVIVLSAHYDAIPGSYGYNDNGMALVTALKLLHKLPANVEFVFTNCEEQGGLGAEYYLAHTQKQIIGCVNLDVVGCFNQVYLDTMNFYAARSLKAKMGLMPYSDAHVFARDGIPSVCFSSGPAETDFRSGIMAIFSTVHNNQNDNNFNLLNFEMIDKVGIEVKKAVELMQFAA
jgi:Zn-dependent M28 family amino/carboxypeptidase